MEPTLGENIARIRRQRSLTQERLAERAGLSVETIGKLERNERTVARMSTLNQLARALEVPTSRLLGDVSLSAARRERDRDQIGLIELRKVLTPARGLGGVTIGRQDGEPPTLGGVRGAVRAADRAYHDDDYRTALAALPSLLADAAILVNVLDGDARTEAHDLLAQAHQVAGTALIQLRAFDLAHRALTLAMEASDRSGNDLVGASTVTTMCWLLLRQGRLMEAEQLAVTTADQIEPRFSRAAPAELTTWGWLLLRASAAAVRDNRGDDAETLLDAAAAAATRLGDRASVEALSPGPASIGVFCSRTVEMKRVENVIVAGDPGRALELARRIPPGGRPTSNNRNRHRLDIASALTQVGELPAATDVLLDLRHAAPTWLRHQRYARDIVRTIRARRRRPMSEELVDLASLMGLEP
ncbi:helix-turn-helix domain-containing protein [Plantactinospora sp. WMMC1484]|uniref:helix-turn-helix domain-containing protein n=1 Tax=Plantactinospora sp. WMMC1484 TaxID=3404122 RepID=UPI003BF4B6EA